MATLPSFLSSPLSLPQFLSPTHSRSILSFPRSPPPPLRFFATTNPRKFPPLVFASSSTSSSSDNHHSSKKSLLSNLILEIEPLDVSLIQKDVPPTTLDAMKRTISGMLGLLPSDRFQVFIEALWEPLSKLLVSSMMTGYTLRNAEYRLCLERNLDLHEDEGNLENQTPENSKLNLQGIECAKKNESSGKNDLSSKFEEITVDPFENIGIQGLGEMSPEAQQYILHLQSQLSFAKKELHEVKRKSAALQMQQFVGEEKNDLLDYLRSLQPEKNLRDISSSSNEETNVELYDSHSYFKDKVWVSVYLLALLSAEHQVAELSEPTSPELKETIHSVVHGLLATLSPKMHSKVPPLSENNPTGPVNVGGEDCAELVENTSLQFQPLVSLTRDYLARLLFWCMLLGHYLRGLEYRMELTELLSLTSDTEYGVDGDEQVA